MKQHVEGYNKRTKGDGPYLPGAFFDPDEKFANAGDPEEAGRVEAAKQPAREANEEEKERAEREALRSKDVPTGQSIDPEPSNGASIYKDQENPSEAPYVDPLPPEITPAPEPESEEGDDTEEYETSPEETKSEKSVDPYPDPNPSSISGIKITKAE